MLRILTLIILCASTLNLLQAQFYDNHWMMGYNGGDFSEPNDSFGVSILSFYNGDMSIENNQEIDLFMQTPSTAVSSYSGLLLLYSNALEIRNRNDEVIIDGVYPGVDGSFETIGPQSIVFLPHILDTVITSFSFLKMYYNSDSPRTGNRVTHSSVNHSTSNNTGAVFNKDVTVVFDSLATGELTACKHANGRDWWVLVPKANDYFIYSVLVTPDTIQIVDTLETAYPMANGLSQTVFSPDGSKYIRINLVTIDTPEPMDIFDFDRCTGELSNHLQTSVGTDAWGAGVAVSPSSQYLYVSHYNHVFQYDLWADDIFETKDTVATYDGYTEWDFFTSRFFLSQLAPDGKIYMNNTSGVKTLHVINQPDLGGEACDVAQHSIPLPNNNAATLANHPNYRLGPIDGSVCDSLGIDNLPRAYYRIDRNPEDTLQFHFQDLSFYEPTEWLWTFGDGEESTERHPNHTYAVPSVYEVCLTVSNELGSDTHCRVLELGPVSVDNPQQLDFTTFPNPVREVMVFDLGSYYPLNGQFYLYNAAGQLVHQEQVLYSQASMRLTHLPSGIYFYEFWDGGYKLGQGKVVKE